MPAFISIDTEESVNVFELSHSDIQSYYDAQAEAYAAAAEAAKTIAESARDAANDSELAAATSETNAAASEQAAAKSESNAATSETNAAASEANAIDSEQAAATSEANAARSETNAATSAQNANRSSTEAAVHSETASTAASDAATSEANAARSETNAAASESSAAQSAVSAAKSANDAEAAFDNFTDLYLGSKASDPTVDNDGNALVVGATYWNSTTNDLRYWNGASWDIPEETAIQAANTAVAARDDAQLSETNAAASASAADTSETNAAQSAADALASQNVAALAASSANTSANNTATSESNAATSESNAATSASNAATSEANAAQSALDAQQSADDAANTLSELEWKQFVRNEATLNQMREQNRSVRAASGFDHYGNTFNATESINEGMSVPTTYTSTWVNQVAMGNYSAASASIGSSKTEFPVTHIAGFITEAIGIPRADGFLMDRGFFIKFPDAPNGTVIYDSTGDVRGTGNSTLNLLTDVDPKYGDVAGDLNEAVARAFEGRTKNGDFRNGSDGSWLGIVSGRGTFNIANEKMTVEDTTGNNANSSSMAVKNVGNTTEANKTYSITVVVDSLSTSENVVNFAIRLGGYTDPNQRHEPLRKGVNTFTYTAGISRPDDSFLLYVGNNQTMVISSVAVCEVTEEVVTERHDMFGAEFFLEEVSQANPFVYPKGMVQSQATSMNGITTTTSNRPVTYYAVYDGDAGSQGLGVDFWAATDEQKKAMVSDETNNIFMLEDGRLVQWRMRQRTIAGAGNGDWFNVNSALDVNPEYQALRWNNAQLRVWAQGSTDTVPAFNTDSDRQYRVTKSVVNPMPHNGVFTMQDNSFNTAVNGECYFHVWGVVPRLNQGAYHPSFNPMGAAEWLKQGVDLGPWWKLPDFTRDTLLCFTPATSATGSLGKRNTGNIGSTSGRPDGKFYDAIYSSGQGGVIDYRLSSWDMSSKEEASKVFQKVVNGTYRGEEKAVFTDIVSQAQAASPNTNGIQLPDSEAGKWSVGDYVSLVRDTDNSQPVINERVIEVNNILGNVYVRTDVLYVRAADTYHIIHSRPTGYSVSGEFTMVDVIGNPAEILATPALANGWLGGWVPYLNIGSGETVPLTRKALSSTAVRISTTDNGSTWATASANVISTTNQVSTSGTTSWVSLQAYTAFAKQTKETSVEKKILNGAEGVGYVWAAEHYNNWTGVSLVESLIGKIPTNSSAEYFMGEYAVINLNGIFNGLLTWTSSDRDAPEHAPITLSQPNNNSPAVKTLWYQTSDNGQASLFLPYNELVYKAYTAPITDTGAQMLRKRGEIYLVDDVDSVLNGRLVIWNGNDGNIPVDYTTYYVDANNVIRSKSSNTASTIQLYTGNGWGDDSTIRIKYGFNTYINMNGDTCLCGTDELAIPYGYTKNQARVGSQVTGVDL